MLVYFGLNLLPTPLYAGSLLVVIHRLLILGRSKFRFSFNSFGAFIIVACEDIDRRFSRLSRKPAFTTATGFDPGGRQGRAADIAKCARFAFSRRQFDDTIMGYASRFAIQVHVINESLRAAGGCVGPTIFRDGFFFSQAPSHQS